MKEERKEDFSLVFLVWGGLMLRNIGQPAIIGSASHLKSRELKVLKLYVATASSNLAWITQKHQWLEKPLRSFYTSFHCSLIFPCLPWQDQSRCGRSRSTMTNACCPTSIETADRTPIPVCRGMSVQNGHRSAGLKVSGKLKWPPVDFQRHKNRWFKWSVF